MLYLIFPVSVNAGFITIDDFTNTDESDGLGRRSYNGMYIVNPPYMRLIAGTPPTRPVAQLVYSFTPSPLIVSPVIRVIAKNNQTQILETGVLWVSINNVATLSKTLFGGKTDFEEVVFDFSNFGGINDISLLTLDWIAPDTGVRELIIDRIGTEPVPEPSTLLLISLVSAFGVLKRKNDQGSFSSRGRAKLHEVANHKGPKQNLC